jgi:GTP-binding protein Era
MRCGKIAVIGRPNVGKSTLVNRLARTRLSIVSPRPQTTRVALKAVITEGTVQLIFIDSPGFNVLRTILDRKMRRAIVESIMESDIIVAMTQLAPEQIRSIEQRGKVTGLHPLDVALIEEITREGKRPDIIVINKIDMLRKREVLLPLMDLYHSRHGAEMIFPLSARTGEGTSDLLEEIKKLVPEGDFLFDPEQMSDRPEKFFAAEYIRETIFLSTHLEVPYASSVVIDSWKDEEKLTRIEAKIYVEKEGQKAILIGKKGSMIKKIGTESRMKIEELLGRHVFLDLTVGVKPEWREDVRSLDRMIDGG